MAAQLADKGHPVLQTVHADRFAELLEKCKQTERPSKAMLELVAKGRQSLQKD